MVTLTRQVIMLCMSYNQVLTHSVSYFNLKYFRASGGRDPSPTSENALPSQHTTDGRNSSPEGVQILENIQGTVNEINERLKLLKLPVTNLENDPKKKE